MAEQLLHTANGRGDGGDGSDGVSGVAEMNKAIQAFVTEHNGTPSLLAAGVSEAQKTRLVQLLIDCASQHGYDITTTWSALRICSRDPQGMGPVLTQTGLQTLLSCVEEHHEAECLKVLINLAITSPGLLQPLVAHLKVLEVLERTAANVSAPSGSESAAAFAPLLMKAIFVLLASYPPLHHELMSLNRLQPFVDTVTTHTTTQPDFAAEALKVLFVVCSGWWKTAPLDPPLIATISAITASLAPWLWHAIRSSPLRAPLLRAALEFLVAVPPPCLPAVCGHQLDAGRVLALRARTTDAAAPASKIEEVHWDPDTPDHRTATTRDMAQPHGGSGGGDEEGLLQDALSVDDVERFALLIKRLDEHRRESFASAAELRDAIVPILVALRNACIISPTMRKFLAQTLLPRRRDVTRAPDDGDGLTPWLIRQLTSPAENLPIIVGELLFQVCNCRVSRLIRRVGYGNAAGYLAARGLPVASADTGDDSSEDDDVDRGVDPISGRRATREPVQWSSEEEKERTAHELLSLIDRLNKLGVIRCNLPHPDDMPDAGGDDGDGDGDGEEGGLSSS